MIKKLRVQIPAEAVGEFSSPESTFYADSYLFRVRSTPVLPQWHIKDLGHSAESANGRLHLHTHTPLTQRRRSGLTMPLSGNELTRNSSGNIEPQSS